MSTRTLSTLPSVAVAAVVVAAASQADGADLEVLVPMRDGVGLATQVFFPDDGSSWPAILSRTPYDIESDVIADPEWIGFVTSRDYAYVIQDTRGRFASEGADSVFWTDGWGALQDGYDTIEWIAAQPWCDGNVGMHGGSARGIVQYLAAGAAPPHLKACVVRAATEDFYDNAFFQGGGYRESLVQGWFDSIDNPEMAAFYSAHPVRTEFWDQVDLGARAASAQVPILNIGGFYGVFGESAIDAFRALEFGGGPGALGNQRLVIGPWTHDGIERFDQGELTYPENSYYGTNTLRWRWYDRWLKGIMNGVDEEPAVDFYLMGDPDDPLAPGNLWISSDDFPPDVVATPYYFHTGASGAPFGLETTPAEVSDDGFWYSHDPATPVATRGGRNLELPSGPYDQRPVHAGRSDILSLRTSPLTEPVIVAGEIRVRFWAECSTPDTDWCAKLIDVYPDGREMLVTDGILRARFRNGFDHEELVVPGEVHEYEIDLWSTALVFATGHRIQVSLSGSNNRRFAINPNNGLPFGQSTPVQVAIVRVRADATYPSHVLLPVATDDIIVATPPSSGRPSAILRVSASPARRVVLTASGDVVPDRVSVYDTMGRLVRTLSPTFRDGGARFVWDGVSRTGARAAPGVYWVRAAAGTRDWTRSVVLLR